MEQATLRHLLFSGKLYVSVLNCYIRPIKRLFSLSTFSIFRLAIAKLIGPSKLWYDGSIFVRQATTA